MTKAEELKAKTDELVKLKQWRPVLVKIQAELQKMLDLLPRRKDRFQHMESDRLNSALKSVAQGFSYDMFTNEPSEGIPFPFMNVMNKRPGLEETDVKIAILEEECKELRAYCKRWPTPDTKHQYKYVGKPDRHTQDGKLLERGDVVLLSETSALALADRFEAVESI
jgi:hypothetical protein